MRQYNRNPAGCDHGHLDMTWSFKPCPVGSSLACATVTLGHKSGLYTGELYTETLYSHTDCSVQEWTVPLVGATINDASVSGITPQSKHLLLFDTGTSFTTFPAGLLSNAQTGGGKNLELRLATTVITLPSVQINTHDFDRIILGVDSLKHLYVEFDALNNYIRVAKPKVPFDSQNVANLKSPPDGKYPYFGRPEKCKANIIVQYAVLTVVGTLAVSCLFVALAPHKKRI